MPYLESVSKNKEAETLFPLLMKILPEHYQFYETDHLISGKHYTYFQDGDQILSRSEEKINALADLFDDLGFTAVTGYYDPEEDEETGNLDSYTGFYYLRFD